MRFPIIVLSAMLMANCAPSEPTSQGAHADAVRAVLTDISAAAAENNAERAAAHYSTAAAMYRAHEIMVGQEITAFYEQLTDEGSIEFAPPITQVSASGDLAYIAAAYREHRVDTNGQTAYEEGDVLMVLVREDGAWRIRHEARSPTVQAER